MIKSFKCKETEKIFDGQFSKKLPPSIQKKATVLLSILDELTEVEELREPQSHQLKLLSGDRLGYWSIRINIQYRIVFKFENQDAWEVEIVDYH